MHRLSQLVHLHRLGKSAREVARLLGMSPNTEREYRLILHPTGALSGCPDQLPSNDALKALVLQGKPEKEHKGQQCKLPPETQALIKHQHDNGAKAAAIYDWLRVEHPKCAASRSAVKRFLATLRRNLGPKESDVVIPVETDPGQVAQVDFGSVGKLWDWESESMHQAYVFVMTLGHSRSSFYRIVFDQRAETWIDLHQQAFRWFGGVPHTVVPDNLKAAVIRAAFDVRTTPELHLSYREFARHYGFLIDPAPPYQPQKKGKVEADVKYVKNNFFATIGDEKDARILNAKLDEWNRQIASQRTHGTTGRRPAEVFESERGHLLSLPHTPWSVVTHRQARVRRDCLCLVEGALYSVPWPLIGREVTVRVEKNKIALFCDDTLVAQHRKVEKGKRVVQEAHLPETRRDYRHRDIEYWRAQAKVLGPDVISYIEEVIAQDSVLSPLGTVISMVQLLQKVPLERAQAACRRASRFGSLRYAPLKNILDRGLEAETAETQPPQTSLSSPKFARKPAEFLEGRRYMQ